MQSYPINMPAGGSQTFSSAARRFVYESGATATLNGDARIIVKPDSGNEIVLRPGQAFGLADGETAGNWFVRANDPQMAISGTVIIGSGDFNDGTFKVDSSTGTIAVRPEGGFQIMNTTANRVPVALDPATEKALTEEPVVTYNAHRIVKNPQQATPVALFTAEENQRGVIIEAYIKFGISKNVLMAKETAPKSSTDGDLIISHTEDLIANQWRRLKIPAGKGLWVWSVASGSGSDSSVLLTFL